MRFDSIVLDDGSVLVVEFRPASNDFSEAEITFDDSCGEPGFWGVPLAVACPCPN